MASFGLEVTKREAHQKIQEIRTRLLSDDFVKNPFQSKIRLNGKDFYVVCIEPLYPPLFWFAVFPLLIFLMFSGRWFGMLSGVIGAFMALLGLWWSNWFYFLLFWFATKKGVKYVSARDSLRRVV